MARFTADGRLVLGQAGGTVSVDGVVPGPLVGVPGGGWAGLSATNEIAGQAGLPSGWRLAAVGLATGQLRLLEPTAMGANGFDAGASRWAAFSAGGAEPGLRDSLGGSWPAAGPPCVSPADDLVFPSDYQNPKQIEIHPGDGSAPIVVAFENFLSNLAITGGAVKSGAGAVVYGDGPTLRGYGAPDPPSMTVFNLRAWTMAGNRRWLVGNTPYGLAVWEWVSGWVVGTPVLGYLLSTDGLDFNPDVWSSDDTTLYLGVGTTQEEEPTQGRKYAIDIVAGQVRRWAWNTATTQYAWGPWTPIGLTDVSQSPTPPLVQPTFAPSTVCRWSMTSGDANDLEDQSNRYRVTTVSETATQQADPRNRAVYTERGDAMAPAIALAKKIGVNRVIQNYDGLSLSNLSAAQQMWATNEAECQAAGCEYLPDAEWYPGYSPALLQAFVTWLTFLGWSCAAWFASYRDITVVSPPTYAWTEQQTLDAQGSAWAALRPYVTFAKRFCYRRAVVAGVPRDGLQAFASLQVSAAHMDQAVQGADIKPTPPKPRRIPVRIAIDPTPFDSTKTPTCRVRCAVVAQPDGSVTLVPDADDAPLMNITVGPPWATGSPISRQGDGSWQWRTPGTAGAYEKQWLNGTIFSNCPFDPNPNGVTFCNAYLQIG